MDENTSSLDRRRMWAGLCPRLGASHSRRLKVLAKTMDTQSGWSMDRSVVWVREPPEWLFQNSGLQGGRIQLGSCHSYEENG